MEITQFKEGDFITRNAPCGTDSSYCGDRLEFIALAPEAKIIFFRHESLNLVDLSYARDPWNKGWCKYPETLYQKIKKAPTTNHQ